MVTGLAGQTDLHLAKEGRTKIVLRSSVTPPTANAVPLPTCTAAPVSYDSCYIYPYIFVYPHIFLIFIIVPSTWQNWLPHKRLLGYHCLQCLAMGQEPTNHRSGHAQKQSYNSYSEEPSRPSASVYWISQ